MSTFWVHNRFFGDNWNYSDGSCPGIWLVNIRIYYGFMYYALINIMGCGSSFLDSNDRAECTRNGQMWKKTTSYGTKGCIWLKNVMFL